MTLTRRNPWDKGAWGPVVWQPRFEFKVTLSALPEDLLECRNNPRTKGIISADNEYAAFFFLRGVTP